jgi:hypothetical protein
LIEKFEDPKRGERVMLEFAVNHYGEGRVARIYLPSISFKMILHGIIGIKKLTVRVEYKRKLNPNNKDKI